MPWKPKPFEWWVNPVTECWEVTSHKQSRDGYINFKGTKAHRYLYQELFGPLEPGMVVRHKCDNRRCINPKHLEKGTPKENSQDMVKRKRVRTQYIKHPEGFRREVAIVAYTRGVWKAVSRYHVNIEAVHRWMNEFGFEAPELNPSRYPLEFKLEVVRYYEKHGLAKTEQMFDASHESIRRWYKKLKKDGLL